MLDSDHDPAKRKKKVLTYTEAKQKAMAYCAYQERSQQQVRDKLYELGLHSEEVENLIADLIADNFLNEERFAKAYAGGKFRMKHWGRYKIKKGLKQHRISDYCIKKGMEEIDPEDYYSTLKDLIRKKRTLLSGKSPVQEKSRIASFAIGKGFEQDLVWEAIKELDK